MAHPKTGYYNAAGKQIPGTTTITGRFADKGGLMWWAFTQGKLAQQGIINSLYDKRDEAADSGTMVHDMVEAYIKELPLPELTEFSEEQQEKVLSGFGAFEQWLSMSQIKIVEQELQLVSEEHQYGGCPDAIGLMAGELCLLDWKTGSSIYPDQLAQLGGYSILLKEHGWNLTGGFHLCRFSKDYGDFSHHWFPELDAAEKQFLLFREAYELDKELKRRAK